jgi:hypothetical protein
MEIAEHKGIKAYYHPGLGDLINEDKSLTPALKDFLFKELNLSDDVETRISSTTYTECQGRNNQRDHIWHEGNKDKNGTLYTVLINENSNDEFQGGLLTFTNWSMTPHKDNFGTWKGDVNKPHQPQWLNEQDVIVCIPSEQSWGIDRVWHGDRCICTIDLIGKKVG